MHSKTQKQGEHNADYIVPNLIGYFGDDWKEIKKEIDWKKKYSWS